jgi:predicted  nucleic acid-binding Zn-ribbon protein
MPKIPNHNAQLRELLDLDNSRRSMKPKSNAFAETGQQIDALREKLPTALLSHYDARRSRGKVPIAPVINGVCRACHLSLPSGRVADLSRGDDAVQVCENCGAFIYIERVETSSSEPPTAEAPKPKKRSLSKAK